MKLEIPGKRDGWTDTEIEVARSALLKTGESGGVYLEFTQQHGQDTEHVGLWLSSKEVDTLITVLAFYKKQTDHNKDFWELKDTNT